MREINVTTKLEARRLPREIEINLSGPIAMGEKFLPHLKTKSEAAIINVSSGLAFVPLPISPVYCATGRSAFVHRVSSCATEKHKVKVLSWHRRRTQTELLGDFDSEDLKGVLHHEGGRHG